MADPAEADIIIINTCGFIESAKTEAIENILMACQYKQENPDLKVIVTGCLAERYKQQIIQEIPRSMPLSALAPTPRCPPSFAASVPTVRARLESYGLKSDIAVRRCARYLDPAALCYLKIAEGCNNGCYYCAIPLIRGACAAVKSTTASPRPAGWRARVCAS